ncbi:MAG: DUF58 domain-containing protein [Omnitrophica WOR_2 bacterium]
MLFDEKTLRKLSQLTLAASQVRSGMIKGERRSVKRGASVEFADYRDYVHGDDLRRLDWNVYARLERPFIKLFEEEEDLAVHILVDGSRSMDWGEGEQNKFRYAIKLAAGLGAITLGAGDHLTVRILYDGKASTQYGPLRGQRRLVQFLSFLEAAQPGGSTDLNRPLREVALSAQRPGLAFLVSDLFAPGGYQPGISQLQSRGYEVSILHLLTPDEIDPPLAGDLRLIDVETGQAQEVSIDGGLRSVYRRRIRDWQAEIQAYCNRRAIHYINILTSTTWDKVVLYHLRSAGIVK